MIKRVREESIGKMKSEKRDRGVSTKSSEIKKEKKRGADQRTMYSKRGGGGTGCKVENGEVEGETKKSIEWRSRKTFYLSRSWKNNPSGILP